MSAHAQHTGWRWKKLVRAVDASEVPSSERWPVLRGYKHEGAAGSGGGGTAKQTERKQKSPHREEESLIKSVQRSTEANSEG